ncbi:SprT-like domain-containing protein [Oceanirhabdus sp. W0125-5]|uniref:SprT-like domain-containing protein n=1 Tax=Oceanirhabdus sp. W0125-5 TaxID=2999116 RepID=UPI0022F2EE3C|nr:SprT-like domain-containing protein [Oceanirhabdus sp. W0125-5]WBW96140.1 SprT-like domain-containing protein [Oceanirhabdus sp. W0125-5]
MELNIAHRILSSEDVISKREEIKKLFIKKSMNYLEYGLVDLSAVDIKILFNLYDDIFFEGIFKNNDTNVKFSISSRMTSAAGKTIAKTRNGRLINDFEIRLSKVFFNNLLRTEEDREVCGLKCEDRLMAVMLIMEHELIHLLEFILYGNSNCSNSRFKLIANNLFGHTRSYHKLPNNREVLKRDKNMVLGDKVSFDFKNEKLEGILYKVNKRAVVMVKSDNGRYSDKKGNRYEKFYVPLDRLKKEL